MKKLLLSILILFVLVGSVQAGCKTAYFLIDAVDTDARRHSTKLISSESFKVIKDKEKKIKEVKGKSDPEDIGKEPVLIIVDGVEVGTEEDIYPELVVYSTVVATLADGRKVCDVLISQWIPDKTRKYHDPESDSDNPLESKNTKYMGIDGKFIGYDREDVLSKYPELIAEEQVGVDELGNPIMVEKFKQHKWNCED